MWDHLWLCDPRCDPRGVHVHLNSLERRRAKAFQRPRFLDALVGSHNIKSCHVMSAVSGAFAANIVTVQCDVCNWAGDLRCLTCLVRAGAALGPALGLALGPLLPGAAPALGLEVLPGVAWLVLLAAAGAEGISFR